ncbi:MAG: serine--tRNA ligase [Alphaproteobacteria bacterium]|jgi:seryl-tRNA synthetase
MHDIKFIREHPEAFDAALARRGLAPQAQDLLKLDAEKRGKQTELQALQARRNEIAKQIPEVKRAGGDAAPLIAEGNLIKERIAAAGTYTLIAEGGTYSYSGNNANLIYSPLAAVEDALSRIPNLLAADVPEGKDESANKEVRRWIPADMFALGFPPPSPPASGGSEFLSPPLAGGTKGGNNATPKDHVALGETLGLMDFAAAAKISGARFVVLKGALARLERALAAFMLDLHTSEFGYLETNPPYLVKDAALYGTGQLPKFAEDLFQTKNDYWLIPTAEVSLTNLVAGEILDETKLPLRFTAHTPCFRSEAGAAGKDTRGMIRQHQFSKVELVSITTPEQSEAEHERMTGCAEEVLKRLGLPYRVMLLCAGDTGFSARKTYDIEVWLPGQNTFREISSCSNCGDFQARRMKARFKRAGAKETEFVHTLNGSGLAVGRTLVAVMENYQQADGSIKIPPALVPYMGGLTEIR